MSQTIGTGQQRNMKTLNHRLRLFALGLSTKLKDYEARLRYILLILRVTQSFQPKVDLNQRQQRLLGALRAYDAQLMTSSLLECDLDYGDHDILSLINDSRKRRTTAARPGDTLHAPKVSRGNRLINRWLRDFANWTMTKGKRVQLLV